MQLMCFTFKKNNKQTKKPVNCFLQDDASAGIQSLQTSIEIKLCQNPGDRLYFVFDIKFDELFEHKDLFGQVHHFLSALCFPLLIKRLFQ